MPHCVTARRALRAIALLAASAPSLLHAQASRDTTRLTPVVVTATRVAAGQAVPTTTATRLDGDDLRARGITLVADALREVPGIAVARGGGQGAVTSVFVRGGESDYLQVLVDGIPMNEPGGAIDLANLTTEDVDRIEIVRGPVSVLYGSEAVSGVVQIFTRRGAGAPRVAVGARAGSRGAAEGDLWLTGASRSVAYSLGGAHTASDGILPFNNQHRRTSASGSIGTAADAPAQVRITARASDGRYHFPTGSGGEAVDSNQFSYERRAAAGIELGQRWSRAIAGHVALTTSHVDAGTDDDPDSPADTAGAYASRSTRRSATHGADARLDLAIPMGATLTTGIDLDWERERANFSSEHGTFGPYRAPERDDRRWNRGYYGQLLGDASGRVSYTLGGRIDDNETFGTFTTYRVAAGVRVAPRTSVRAAIGTAFKAPIFYEITGAGFANPNESIEPERSRSWDAGIEHALAPGGRTITLAATYFDQRFRDLIQFIPNPVDPFALGQYRNIAGARATGIELEARAAATSRLTILASATALETEVLESREGGELAFQEGEPLIRRPRIAASAITTYRIGAAGSVSANVRHVGRREDVDFTTFSRVTLPSHTLLGASAELPVGGNGRLGSFVLRIAGENLLNTTYKSIAGFPSPGRTVLLGARATLGM